MLIVFGAAWCGPCQALKSRTLQDARLANYVNQAYVPVYLDFDAHTKLAKILEVNRVPTTMMLTPNADLLGRHVGFADSNEYSHWLRDAEILRMQVRQAEAYQNMMRR